jgi:hypothetical protein
LIVYSPKTPVETVFIVDMGKAINGYRLRMLDGLMAKKQSTLSVALRATGAMFSNLPVILPLAGVLGTIVAALDIAVMKIVAPAAMASPTGVNQNDIIALMFGWWGVILVVEIVLGPIVAAMAIYTARTHSHGGKASLYKAANFAMARYGRIVKWHAAAWMTIQVGMIVLVPGILFLLQYAFVDSILCLEDEKWPLERSSKLTKGRRGRIFALVFLWLVVNQVVGFAELAAIQMGFPTLVLLMSATYVVNIWVTMVFYQFYEDRTQPSA